MERKIPSAKSAYRYQEQILEGFKQYKKYRDKLKDPAPGFIVLLTEYAYKDHDYKKCYSRAENVFFSE
jgi:hypothetical protein